jgi:NAD(P)H-nitrite reductase large subunit
MRKILIIGNSAAGVSCAETIRKNDKEAKITIVSKENYPCYSRCLISYYLAGDIPEPKLIFRDETFFKDNSIELILGQEIERIDIKKKQAVVVKDEESSEKGKIKYDYDILVLANGASSKMPEIKGINKRGVFAFRTIDDAKSIMAILPVADTACVLGGGLIGLKAAYALKKRGLDVKVIVKSKQVLSQVLDYEAAEFFKNLLNEKGIEIVTGSDVKEILGNGDIKAIKLDSGKVIACQIVVVGKGVSPNIKLIKETPINVNEGILTNEYMQTNIESIFACGDIAETYDISFGEPAINALWPNAVEQGKIAGENICGKNVKYAGSLGMNSVEFFGLPVISMGITRPGEGFEAISKSDMKSRAYRKVIIKDNHLVGAILVGRIENSGVYLNLIHEKTDISSIKDLLLSENFSYPQTISLSSKGDSIYV